MYTQKNSCVPESTCGPKFRTGLKLAPVSAPVVTMRATVRPPSSHGVTRGRFRRCAAARTTTSKTVLAASAHAVTIVPWPAEG